MVQRGSEAATRKLLAAKLVEAEPDAHVVQVENGAVGPGTPDTYVRVRGTAAWIEVKYAKAPARPTTPVRLRHLTTQQVGWHAAEIRAGGRVWLLLQLSRDYLLLHPKHGPGLRRGAYTAPQLAERAERVWKGALPGPATVDFLVQTPCNRI